MCSLGPWRATLQGPKLLPSGAGSVVGDTTTTIMWIAGISPLLVAKAYFAAFIAFIVFAVPSSLMQQRWQPIQRDPPAGTHIVMSRIWIVLTVLAAAITANVLGNVFAPDLGFGGSMMWFGSSAGVAVCNEHPEARSVVKWLQAGWPVLAGYFSGILAYWALLGWAS